MPKNLILRMAKGSPLTFQEQDGNLTKLLYWSGDWVPITYTKNEVVRNQESSWVCIVDSTNQEPTGAATDWALLAGIPDSVRGIGSLSVSSNKSYGTVGAAWTPLNLWDAVSIPVQNCTMNTNGTFTFGLSGWWQVYLYLDITHDEANAGRTLGLRLYNVTAALPGSSIIAATGRNVGVTTVSLLPWINVTPAQVGNTWRVEWSDDGGLDYASVVVNPAVLRLEHRFT